MKTREYLDDLLKENYINAETHSKALNSIKAIGSVMGCVIKPDVAPIPDDGVSFVWSNKEWVITLDIFPDRDEEFTIIKRDW